jgi:hypothetical protein
MYSHKNRFLFALLLCAILLCSSVQATNLLISVQDSVDNSTIPHATVFVNGANFARTNANVQVYLTHNGLNDQLIRISMTGYNDWEKLVSKNETFLQVNITRKDLTLKVSLFDSDTRESVSGADIKLSADNSTETKHTDVSGSATFYVKALTLYSIAVEAPNYQPRSSNIDMGSENKDVQYWLLSENRFSVVVREKDSRIPIPDAEVRMNSVLAGKTDSQGNLNTPLTRGNVYTIEVKKPGYQTSVESRTISETDALYTVELTKSPLGAFIYVYDENHAPVNNADIYINGALSGTTNQYGRVNLPALVSGTYPVEIKKTGYITISRPIVVSSQDEEFTFDMSFENADLTISVQDKDQKIVPNASIIINNNPAGMTDEHGQYATKVKFNAPYNITSTKEGYQPATLQKEFIQGNSTVSANLILEKNPDWGLITMIALGAVGVIILFAVIRMLGHRKRGHIIRRNEI